MKKPKINFMDLLKKSKEEVLKDRAMIEEIEKRVDEKIMNSK